MGRSRLLINNNLGNQPEYTPSFSETINIPNSSKLKPAAIAELAMFSWHALKIFRGSRRFDPLSLFSSLAEGYEGLRARKSYCQIR